MAKHRGGDVAQFVEHRTGTPLTQVRFPGAARDFSLRVNFQCRLSYGVRTSPSAIACIYICKHVKDPVVPVRVRWVMETLKHPACSLCWVARLCRSWLSPGKATRISHGRNPIGTVRMEEEKKTKNLLCCEPKRDNYVLTWLSDSKPIVVCPFAVLCDGWNVSHTWSPTSML